MEMKEVYVVFRREYFLWDDYHDVPVTFFLKKEDAEKELNNLVDKKINGITYHIEHVKNGNIKEQLTEMQHKLNLA